MAYCILSQFESAGKYVLYLFLASPVLVIWLVMTVLMHGRYNGKSLGDREFGYQDKEDDELGTF